MATQQWQQIDATTLAQVYTELRRHGESPTMQALTKVTAMSKQPEMIEFGRPVQLCSRTPTNDVNVHASGTRISFSSLKRSMERPDIFLRL